jgi:hypothetical protein
LVTMLSTFAAPVSAGPAPFVVSVALKSPT